jgi:uncharacterized repeat protein (TIGR01451 family)
MEFRHLFLAGLLFVYSNLAFGALQPANPRLENFDKRSAASSQQATISIDRELALNQLHARQPRARVEFDAITGSPKSIEIPSGFLSGSNGVGGTLSAGAGSAIAPGDRDRATKAFLEEYRGLFHYGSEVLDSARVIRDDTMAHNGLRTAVWQQEMDGIPVFEAVLISHTTRRGELVNLSSQFQPDASGAIQRGGQNRANLAPSLQVTAAQALVIAASGIGEQLSQDQLFPQRDPTQAGPGPTRKQEFRAPPLKGSATVGLTWLPMNSSQLRLCWDVILTGRSSGAMFRVLVDTTTGEALVRHCLTTDISDATYRVYTGDSPSPFSPGYPSPTTAQPPLVPRSLLTLPALDVNASPNGWIDDGVNETRGNNVDAHTDLNDDDLPDLPRPQGSPFRVFDFPLDLNSPPSSYRDAAVVQLFYLCNWMHDTLYGLGFTEAAGNFQNTNFNRGGLGGDAVQADAQDGSGLNNANFSTPPDGSPGRMQMYVFSGSTPNRDGDLDAEIVLHEYTHGLSNRRVGGGVGITDLQPAGMGEGWSDFYALSLLSEPGDNIDGNYAIAAYSMYSYSGSLQNYYFGIRRYPYSTDLNKNPLTFKDIDPNLASSHPGIPKNPVINGPAWEVHSMGEVWCVTLWDARANLLRKYGWAVGNRLILQLVTDAMALSPPNPTFLQARDAILQADMVDTGGTNQIDLWQAFAKRGMGPSATCPNSTTSTGVHESFEVPDDLQITPFSGRNFSYQSGKVSTPVCLVYQLINSSTNNIQWSATVTAPWISLDSSNGVIAPGNSNAVTVCLNSTANELYGGDYFGAVAFSNSASAFTDIRPLSLHLIPPQVLDYSLDTQPGFTFDGEWQFGQPAGLGGTQYGHPDPTAGATGTNVFGINLNGDYSLTTGTSNYMTAGPFDFTGFTGVSLHFQRWLNSDFQPFVFETLEVSTDGTNWNTVWDNGQSEAADSSWTPVAYDISAWADNHSNVYVRWGHRVASSLAFPYSGWNIDDVEFWGNPPPRLSINVPAAADVSSGVQIGTVIATPPSVTNLTVTLTSSDAAVAGVPNFIVIPAGQSNAVFNIALTNELSAPPSATVSISAVAPGYFAGAGTILLSDSNALTLRVSLSGTVGEGDGTLAGSVAIRDPQTNDLTIELTSSDPSTLQVPDSVIIAQGQTNAVFSATLIDNTAIDGSRNLTVTGQSAGWTNGVATVVIQDNENLNLTVTAPANAWENGGTLSNGGTVLISGTLATNLIVSLTSSVSARLAVPDNVTIAAGQTSATFDITPIDNPDSDGNQLVNIDASAAGFTVGAASITVLDDETPAAASNPLPPDLATNVDPIVILAWTNAYLPGAITNDVYFGTNPAPGAAELVGSTTNQSWALPLLAPQTTYYWQIVAHRVGVAPGPVWQFTTRGLDHFTWNPISSPQHVNEPFAVTVVARDAHESIVSNYTGTVQLTGSPAGISPGVSGAFVDGMWQGNVTVAQLTSGESLAADDGAGHTGASGTFDVVLTNDVSISIFASTNPAPVGAPLTYILTVTNTGDATAMDVRITDFVPPRAIVNSVVVSQGSWAKTNEVLTASLGTISGGTNATVTIELTPTTFGDVLTNVASVTRAESEAYLDNNVATNTTTVGLPALSIFDITTPEGNSDTTNAAFTVTLSAPSSEPVAVSYATADGSAHAGTDYIGTNGILVLAPGATNAVISVAIIGDLAVESDKDFQVNLSDPTNAVLTQALGVGTILDGDKYSGTSGHFDWSAIPSPQQTKVPFDVTVTAAGFTGLAADTFDRLIALSTTVAGVRLHPAVSGTFTNGIWMGQVTVDDPASGLILKADDYGGHTGLSSAFDVVRGNMPPAILSQPTNGVVTNGSAVVIAVVVDGTPPLSYQWSLNGTNVTDATNSTFTIASAQLIDGGEYVVQVSNGFGIEQSAPASLMVGDPPVISAQPTNRVVNIGQTAEFEVLATGTEPLNYQWSHNGGDLADATNATLIISPATTNDAGDYSVRVFNLFGSQISSNATLSVGLAATVTSQPTNVAAAVGGDATFIITADGTAPLSYQWSFNGTNLTDATNSTLTLTNVQTTDAGDYAVQVSNLFGTDQSSNAVLVVGDPPLITGQPASQSVVLGTSASFTVTVTGTEPLNYQWSHEGTDLTDATNASLTITNSQLGDAGNYAVRVFNLFGTQTSSNALFTVGILPSVSIQPTNVAVAVGGDATFIVIADGTAPLNYQWSFNGTNVLDATNSTLTLTNVQIADAGDYAVQVSNAFGTDQSSNAVLVVGDPPLITGQPANQSVVLGASASFTVTASGTEPLNYQWSHEGADLIDATNASLTITNSQLGDAGNYAVRVFNLFGTQSSSNALLTVGILPSVTTQPTNVAVEVGGDATFTITADGTAPLNYQWSFNGTNVMDATNSTLALTNVQIAEAGDYAVLVSNAFGTEQSSNAVLVVGDPPLIAAQPANQSIVLGTAASFTVTATGTEPLNYQWSHEAADLTDATNATLTIPSSQLGDAGNYSVRVFNLFGTQSSSNALLTVGILPSVTAQPTNVAVAVGGDATFVITADGTASLSYQWSFNGTNITDATNSMLTLTNVQTTDAGDYAVQVSNAFGTDQSSNAVLVVGDPPLITGQPSSQSVVLGTSASFTVTATGTEPLNYQWSHEAVDLTDATNATLTIASSQLDDVGNYAVRVFNVFGTQSSSNALLTVGILPSLTTQPTNVAVAIGGDATFTITADGTAPLGYQWSFNGTNVTDATNSMLILTNVQIADAGDYAVQVSNAFGTDQSSNAVLLVGDPPLITGQPANQTVVLGASASFTVTASGTEPLNYQWSHEGADLTDATNATLTITNSQLGDAGNYVVRVVNLFGTQTSSNALLTVGILPSVTTQPTNVAVALGGDATFTITANGTAPLSYQWSFNGTNVIDATNSVLTLTNVQTTNAGDYAVQVSNAFGTDQSSNAVLVVGDPPLITSQPANQTIVLGAPAAFTVTATGSDSLEYQWSHEGADLTAETNATLTIPSVQLNDDGNYAVRVFNLFGTQTSSNALLTVGILPSVTTQPTNFAVAVGGDATFIITAEGTAPLSYQWSFNGTNVMDATNSMLMLTNVQTTNAGDYAVQVSNAFGTDQSSNAVLVVGDPPLITSQPANQAVVLGTATSFTVTATGTDLLNYQWSHEGVDLTSETNATLTIPSVQPNDAGKYAVRVFNLFGTQTSSNALLTVVLPPVILVQPTNQSLAAGTAAQLSVTADGTMPFHYQWRRGSNDLIDDGRILGANSSTLVISNLLPTDSDSYSVIITNLAGVAVSSNATLIVYSVDHFTWNPIPAARFVNVPFPVTIQALDVSNNVVAPFSGPVSLATVAGNPVSPSASGNFTNGVWSGFLTLTQKTTGTVLVAADGLGHVGYANTFDVVDLPLLIPQPSGSSLVISWSAYGPVFSPETSSDLQNWTPAGLPIDLLGAQFKIRVRITDTNTFYRLRFIGP